MDPKKLAQKVAKQFTDESLEILKTASEQVTGNEQVETPQEKPHIDNGQAELQDKMRTSRRMEAYQRELDDIRKQDVFRDLQRRISEGEEVPVNDYPELSTEQKQVLNAQMEAVKFQKKQAEYAESQSGGRLFGSAKKSRRMGQGQKQEAEKHQTRVEKPVPPSG